VKWLTLMALTLSAMAARSQDTTPPTLVSVSSADGLQIGVCFSEVMNSFDLDSTFNYQVSDQFGAMFPDSVTIRPGVSSCILHLPTAVSGVFTVAVENVSDLEFNVIAPGSSITGQVWRASLASADIGAPWPSGLAFTCLEGQLTVSAGGANIGGAADQFNFLYSLRTNDFDVQVRVDSLLFVGQATAKAGIHVRESLEANSPFFMAYVTPTNGANQILIRGRPVASQSASDFITGLPVDTFPVWLRVKRAGITLATYYSRDGRNWNELGALFNIPLLPPVLLVGLGTVSRLNGTATIADYQHFTDTLLHTNTLITFTRQPTNVVAEENTRATFTVEAMITDVPAADLRFQWQAETSPGSGVYTNAYWATGRSFTTPFLSGADSGTHFRVLVSVIGQAPVISEPAMLTVVPDVTGPHALAATGPRSLREIIVEFSEPLEPVDAQNPANYVIAGFTVTGATLDAGGARVVLVLNASQTPGSTNTVRISGLRDLAGHGIDPNPQFISAPAFIMARGVALQELYFGLGGNITITSLRDSPKFPSSPDDTRYVPLLEGPTGSYEEYGTRISGFLAPKVTGSYHFFICSDDQSEFWLSTDDNPANSVLLCREPQWMFGRSYTNLLYYDGTAARNPDAPENRSSTLFPASIPLTAGRLYYFEALAKEGYFADNLAVAWQPPGAPLPESGSTPIPGEFLAALAPPGGAAQLLEQPSDFHYDFNPPLGATVHDETFTSGDGGYTVTDSGTQSPWSYAAIGGQWTVNGSATLNTPSWSALSSPAIVVPRSGPLLLQFWHRYSFEYDGTRWDGGQVRLSVNGGAFQPVVASRFCAQGYAGTIQGGGILQGREGFNGYSPGYESGVLIVSAANLGHFNADDSLRLQFLGAWDDLIQGSLPNWLIDRVNVVEGECASPATFTVVAEGSLPGVMNQAINYQWQRDCGSGFSNIVDATDATYSFVPVLSDVACRFRCLASLPGISATSSVARVTVTPPQLAIRTQGPNVVITWTNAGSLQHALNVTGPWVNVGGTISNTYTVRPSANPRFYRVRVP
jgi:hypothetical protein